MNKAFFIAKRINKGNNEGKKVSQPIVRISTLSIALAVAVNIITVAVVTGFQNQVRDKVVGFGSHIQILKAGEVSSFESEPILKEQQFLNSLKLNSNIKGLYPFAYKPALFQSIPDTIWYRISEKDTFQIEQEIQGVVIKGVDSTYDWSFFSSKLLEGRIPNIDDEKPTNEIIISKTVADNLHFKLGDKARTFFIKENPVKKIYTIVGIFKSGLEELDKKIVIGDLRNIQKLNNWGIQTAIRVADTVTSDNQLVIYAQTIGGNGNYRYDFGEGWETNKGFTYCDIKDTTVRLITSDYWMFIDGYGEEVSKPDTAYLNIKVSGNVKHPCIPLKTEDDLIIKNYLNKTGTKFSIDFVGGKKMTFEYIDGKGTYDKYVAGYELIVNNWDLLDQTENEVAKEVLFNTKQLPNTTETNNLETLRIKSIKEDQEEIFMWLSFLDLNVYIILILMLLIGIINMGSGLLVIILSKTNFIGLMKALGSSNWLIRKVFLYQASFLILKGMFWGNLVGIGFCVLQQYFNILPLNPEIYYLSAVPVELNFWHVILLNIGTLIICTAALIIPSYVITRISPVKALKFD